MKVTSVGLVIGAFNNVTAEPGETSHTRLPGHCSHQGCLDATDLFDTTFGSISQQSYCGRTEVSGGTASSGHLGDDT